MEILKVPVPQNNCTELCTCVRNKLNGGGQQGDRELETPPLVLGHTYETR